MARKLGTAVQIIGLLALAYGWLIFAWLQYLPPNTAESRLPSVYVIFAAIGVWLVGSTVKTFARKNSKAIEKTANPYDETPASG